MHRKRIYIYDDSAIEYPCIIVIILKHVYKRSLSFDIPDPLVVYF